MEISKVGLSWKEVDAIYALIRSGKTEEVATTLKQAKEAALPNVLVLSSALLNKAIYLKSFEAVRLIVDTGVSQEALDKALLEATRDSLAEENLDITKYLLEAGANPHALESYGHSALSHTLYWAEEGDYDAINTVKLLLPYCNHNDLNALVSIRDAKFNVLMLAVTFAIPRKS